MMSVGSRHKRNHSRYNSEWSNRKGKSQAAIAVIIHSEGWLQFFFLNQRTDTKRMKYGIPHILRNINKCFSVYRNTYFLFLNEKLRHCEGLHVPIRLIDYKTQTEINNPGNYIPRALLHFQSLHLKVNFVWELLQVDTSVHSCMDLKCCNGKKRWGLYAHS